MTSGDPWTPPLEAFGRFTAQRKLAKRQLRELAAPNAQHGVIAATQTAQMAIVEAVQWWSQTVDRVVPANVLRESFDVAEQLLGVQREFAERVLAAARAAIDRQA